MKLTIHVTASGAKRLLIVGSLLIVLGTAAVSLAIPVPFVSNTTLKAADLNADFAATEAITVGTGASAKSYARAAIFAKATTSTYYGNMHASGSSTGPTGYVGAKAICETLVGSNTAHMCTADELIRSAQLGAIPAAEPSSWYASGVLGPTNANDCKGWTDDGTSYGSTWNFLAAAPPVGASYYPGSTACSQALPILCCD